MFVGIIVAAMSPHISVYSILGNSFAVGYTVYRRELHRVSNRHRTVQFLVTPDAVSGPFT
jgi:hypothetical protein